MTERFTIQGQSIKHNDELLTLNMVCEMLNDYAKENEQLRKDSTVLILANQDYRKENEQLRELLENGLDVSQVEIDEELERMNKMNNRS